MKVFDIRESVMVPGTHIMLENGDKVYFKEPRRMREAAKAGLQCSNIQGIMTPRFRYDAHHKYGGLDARPCPADLEKVVMNAGFYKNGDAYRKTQGAKDWNLYYLGTGRDFRLALEGSGGPKEDYIVTLR